MPTVGQTNSAPVPGHPESRPPLLGTVARVVLPGLRATARRPLRVLCTRLASGALARELQALCALLDRDTVGVLHGADPDAAALDRAREAVARIGKSNPPRSSFLRADPVAENEGPRKGVVPGCYDLVIHESSNDEPTEKALAVIDRLRGYLRATGVLVLPGLSESARSAAIERLGLRPWPDLEDSSVFRAEGPPPPPRIEDLLGRRAVAVCGMPRAGTTFVCDAVRIFGPLHGLFVTPRFWMSPIKLEEGARLNAVNDDLTTTAADLVPFMKEAADWYRVPDELGLVCKLPQMVWRPDLLRGFSTVILTVRSLDEWLDSALRYRDTVMHAAGPAAWLPEPVQEHVREHFDGDFLMEYGRSTREQVEQLDEVLDVEHRVFEYGQPERMRESLDRMGLPAEEILTQVWQGCRRQV